MGVESKVMRRKGGGRLADGSRKQGVQGWAPHSFPFRTFRSFKECSVLSGAFFEFLATYETQKNGTFFSVLSRSFQKNGKERKDRPILL